MNNNLPFSFSRQSAAAMIPWLLLAIFLTALDIHFIATKISTINLHYSLQASQGVVDGLPHWRIYQSRVLGPYLVHGMAHLLNLSAPVAYITLIALLQFATKLVVISFGLGHARNKNLTFMMLISGSLLFAMLLTDTWLYPWDIIGFLLSTLFVVMVLRKAPWPWFILLAAVAFLNRDSGFFICAWLFIQGLLGYGEGGGRKSPHIGMLAAALVMAGCGLAVMDWLRDHLLVREVGPELWGNTPDGGSWFHWKLSGNLEMLMLNLTLKSPKLPLLFYLFPLAGMAAAATLGIRHYPVHTALCLTYFINMVFIFLFSVMEEPRAMIEIIPFFSVFLIYFFAGPGKSNLKPASIS